MTTAKLFRQGVLDSPGYSVAHIDGAIKLNQNESPWDLPLELKVAITEKLIKTDFNRYPLADPLILKKKLAKYNNLLTDQIILAPGSNVLIQAIINATSCRPKGKVLVLDPSFMVYQMQAELLSCAVVKVPLNPDFSLPTDAVIAAIRKENPTLIFIANPNAPTGNLFAKENLYKIVKAANCLTVIDEAYFPFCETTLVDWLNEFPHLLVLRTLSKAYALAGVRLGYAMADTEVITQLEKVIPSFIVSSTACLIAGEVLEHGDYVKKYVKDILAERQRIFAEMQKMTHVMAFPSDANYILFRTDNAKNTVRELKDRGILVRDVSDNHLLKNCIRVSIGTPVENTKFINALKEIL